jgi:hypothetical protein
MVWWWSRPIVDWPDRVRAANGEVVGPRWLLDQLIDWNG